MVPKRYKCSWPKGDNVHISVLSVILSNTFSHNLAGPVPRFRFINAGCGNEYNLVDTEGNSSLENLEGAAHIQVKKNVGIFRATDLVDARQGRYVDNAIAANEEFL
jgi:hypothetical protein